MAIVRTYKCEDCSTTFDKLHFDRSEGPPECPGCQAIAAKQTQVPAGFSIGGGTISKAGDLCQDIVERDYGMSNMRDNMREGDIAAITPPTLAPAVNNFFRPSGNVLQSAKMGAQLATREGRNPMTMIQQVSKSQAQARGATRAQVMCRPVNRVR